MPTSYLEIKIINDLRVFTQPRDVEERYALLSKGGQIVDATIIAAPKQRNTKLEKQAIKDSKKAAEIWPDRPAKAAQKDVNARWR